MARKVLVLAANPKDTSRLRLDQEIREIDNGLQRAQKRDEFILKSVLAARPMDVRRAMLDFKPNIVHFCGHGTGDEGIAFEDETGHAKLVNAETLAGFFELFASQVECVVLNACYAEVQAEAIAQHINYVVGMRREIGDTTAIEFAVAFYDALGAGESIEFAYRLACNAIQWTSMPEHLTPVLKVKAHTTEIRKEQVYVGEQTHQETLLARFRSYLSNRSDTPQKLLSWAANVDEEIMMVTQSLASLPGNFVGVTRETISQHSHPLGFGRSVDELIQALSRAGILAPSTELIKPGTYAEIDASRNPSYDMGTMFYLVRQYLEESNLLHESP